MVYEKPSLTKSFRNQSTVFLIENRRIEEVIGLSSETVTSKRKLVFFSHLLKFFFLETNKLWINFSCEFQYDQYEITVNEFIF